MDTRNPFVDLAPWQALLERNGDTLGSLKPGAAIGLLPSDGEYVPRLGSSVDMMVWSVTDSGMQASSRPYAGFQDIGVDLLLVLFEEALQNLVERIEGDPFSQLSRDSGKGAVLMFYLKERGNLVDLGYEGFFDAVGLSFAGACR